MNGAKQRLGTRLMDLMSAILAWRHTVTRTKATSEVSLVAKPACECNASDRGIRLDEHPSRNVQTSASGILPWGASVLAAKDVTEVDRMYASFCCE